MLLNYQNILAKTRKGLDIYLYVLREYFPKKNILAILEQGLSLPNPFLAGGRLLVSAGEEAYQHQDLSFPALKGNAIDLAGHHFKAATNNELYFLINQNLSLGLKISSEEMLEQLEKAQNREDLPRLSFFEPPISNTRPSEQLTLPQIYRRITGPAFRECTEKLRLLNDSKDARKFKASHFPYVTFGGCFSKRSDKHLLEPSGLMVIDLDDLPEVEEVRKALIAETDYETELLFVSPSGRGLKWITSYPHQKIDHLDYFHLLCSHLEALYDLTPDPSGKDISRACFLAADNQCYIHRKYVWGVGS